MDTDLEPLWGLCSNTTAITTQERERERRAFSEDREDQELGVLPERGGAPGLRPASLLTQVGSQISRAPSDPAGKFRSLKQSVLHRGAQEETRGPGAMVLGDSLLCNEGLGVSGGIVQPASGKLAHLRRCWEERKCPGAECAEA